MSRLLGQFHLQLVAAPAYLAQHGTPALPGDLARHNCLLYKFPSSGKIEAWPLAHWNALLAAGLPASLSCNSVDTLLHFAESGLGIAALPDFAARAAREAGRLQLVLAEHTQHAAPFHILWPGSRNMSPKLRVFIDFLVANLFPKG